MDHDPIRSEIDPTLFGISGDRNVPRAYVSASVTNVVPRCWKTQYVDVLLLPHIFQQWAVLDFLRWDRLQTFNPLPPDAHEFHSRKIYRHPRSKSNSLDRI